MIEDLDKQTLSKLFEQPTEPGLLYEEVDDDDDTGSVHDHHHHSC